MIWTALALPIQPSQPLPKTQTAPGLSLSLPLFPILPSHPQRRRSPAPTPRRPHSAWLPAGTALFPHSRLISSPPTHPRVHNREFLLTLATGLPTGVEDDGPRSRVVRLASGWGSPSIYRPWEPLLVHGTKDCSWPSPSRYNFCRHLSTFTDGFLLS
jgi:hypothetical protein